MSTEQLKNKYQQSSREKKIIIKNSIFTDKIIYNISPLGFALLSYLLYESRNTTDVSTTMSIVMKKLTIQTKETIIKRFNTLKECKLIDYKEDLKKIGIHDRFEIDLSQYYNLQEGFEQIPGYIFIDNYIDEYSWTIFCLLCKMYHTDYGNAMLTQEEICFNTGIKDKRTIRDHLKRLEDKKLITIINSKTFFNPFVSTDTNNGYYPESISCKYQINFYSQKQGID
jgi:hypothetical protein